MQSPLWKWKAKKKPASEGNLKFGSGQYLTTFQFDSAKASMAMDIMILLAHFSVLIFKF